MNNMNKHTGQTLSYAPGELARLSETESACSPRPWCASSKKGTGLKERTHTPRQLFSFFSPAFACLRVEKKLPANVEVEVVDFVWMKLAENVGKGILYSICYDTKIRP